MVFGARKGGNTFPLILNTKTKLLPNAALKFRKLNRGPLIIKTSGFFVLGEGGRGDVLNLGEAISSMQVCSVQVVLRKLGQALRTEELFVMLSGKPKE